MDTIQKEPLDREELRDVIDLALWAGQMLLQNGADAERVEETVHRHWHGIGRGMGRCAGLAQRLDRHDHQRRGISHQSAPDHVTLGVNMAMVEGISHLNHRVAKGSWIALPCARNWNGSIICRTNTTAGRLS